MRGVEWVVGLALLALLPAMVAGESARATDDAGLGVTGNAGAPASKDGATAVQLVDDEIEPRLRSAPRLLDLPALEVDPPEKGEENKPPVPGAGASYALGDSLMARLHYRHAYLFGTAANETLQNASFSAFSTEEDRDIVNLQMSWRLTRSTVDLGYRFESTRPEARAAGETGADGRHWLPGSEDMLHGLMLGFTREFGGAH